MEYIYYTVGVYLALGVIQFAAFLYAKYPKLAWYVSSQEEAQHVHRIKSWVRIVGMSFYVIVPTWPSYVWMVVKTLREKQK